MKHRAITVKLFAIVIAAAFHVHANGADSADALIVLTTVGYLTGAADVCKVVLKESNQLSSGLALAIGRGNYGDPAKAHVLFNNARQEGIKSGTAGKVNCVMVGDAIKQHTHSLLAKVPPAR
ncbi:MAG: hypothetical protein ABIQ54_02100 [Gammaproteobacteria bacterium]